MRFENIIWFLIAKKLCIPISADINKFKIYSFLDVATSEIVFLHQRHLLIIRWNYSEEILGVNNYGWVTWQKCRVRNF